MNVKTRMMGWALVAVTGLGAGCGSAGSSRSIGATASMPTSASSKAMDHAEACDDGELKSCNWLGIWFLVGGAGKERRVEGVRYLKHACNEGYQPSCKLIDALRRKAQGAS